VGHLLALADPDADHERLEAGDLVDERVRGRRALGVQDQVERPDGRGRLPLPVELGAPAVGLGERGKGTASTSVARVVVTAAGAGPAPARRSGAAAAEDAAAALRGAEGASTSTWRGAPAWPRMT
jgi:hypothetical protein